MTKYGNRYLEEQYRQSMQGKDLERMKLPDDIHSFEEVQTLDQGWLWALMGIEALVVMIPLLMVRESWWVFVIAGIVMMLTFTLLSKLQLRLKIDDHGIHYKLDPSTFGGEKTVRWRDIESVSVRKMSRLTEKGGYGLHYGRRKRVYNMGGTHALEIRHKNGKKIVIGTRRHHELTDHLERRPVSV